MFSATLASDRAKNLLQVDPTIKLGHLIELTGFQHVSPDYKNLEVPPRHPALYTIEPSLISFGALMEPIDVMGGITKRRVLSADIRELVLYVARTPDLAVPVVAMGTSHHGAQPCVYGIPHGRCLGFTYDPGPFAPDCHFLCVRIFKL